MRKLLLGMLTLALACFGTGYALATDDGMYHGPSGEPGGTVLREYGDGSLTTMFASDNSHSGNSFDVEALTDLTICGWDCNLEPGMWTIEIYTRNGTCDGYEQIASEWTLLGTDLVTSAGNDQPTHVDVGGLSLSAGQLVGVIAHCLEYGGFNYTNGGPLVFTNDDMSITTYRGLSDGWPPSSVFTYRAWNGTVHYNYDGGTPVESSTWGQIKALF